MTDIVLSQDFFPRIGGAHSWLYEVYRRWPTPVTFLTQHYDGNPAEVLEQEQFDRRDHGSLQIVRRDLAVDEINLLERHCRRRFGKAVALVRSVAADSPATVHCLRAFPEGLAGLLTKVRNPRTTRLVCYAHGEEILVAQSSRQLRLIASLVYRFSDLVIANSKNTESLVRALYPRAKVVVVHPGVDQAAYVRTASEIRQFRDTWPWPHETIVIATVARMEPRKNQQAVIRAVAALRCEGLPLAYVCAGDGAERSRLAALARELGIEEFVGFPGVLADRDKILTFAACDVHAMPSIRVGEMIEGFGIVFLEAGAAGVPSICGNIGGQPEAVADGRTGIVVDGTDVAALQSAIRRLATDRELRTRMGREAARRAAEEDWSKVSARIQSAVQDCATHVSDRTRAAADST